MAEQPNIITDDNWQKRKCSKCGEWKYHTGYGGETRKWQYQQCPDCAGRYQRDRRRIVTPDAARGWYGAGANNKVFRQRTHRMPPDITRQVKKQKDYWINRRIAYGIEKWDWLLMYHRQGGLCAICRLVPMGTNKETSIDHDHQTGVVRGLICQRCNMGMAYVDQPGWVEAALAYKAAADG